MTLAHIWVAIEDSSINFLARDISPAIGDRISEGSAMIRSPSQFCMCLRAKAGPKSPPIEKLL
jgi:hypothetical protein